MKTAYRSIIAIVLVSLLVSLMSVSVVNTQEAPEVEWEKTFGGSEDDEAYSVQQTSDGGYIIAGYTSYYGAYLIKTDESGHKQWEKIFNPTGNTPAIAYSVRQTSDGGYIVVGGAHQSPFDAFVIKTDNKGDTLWTQILGLLWLWDEFYSVQETTDGSYIIAGYTESYSGAGRADVWLIKTDASGETLWEKTFGGSDNDYGYSVQQTSDGGYIIAGKTSSFGAAGQLYLIKTDASGNKQWEKTFGGNGVATGWSVQQTSDGGYIIAGGTGSPDDPYGCGDLYLLKTDASGDKQWEKTFGGSENDEAYSVQQTSDGGYIIAGKTCSFGAGYYDVYLIKLRHEFGDICEGDFDCDRDVDGSDLATFVDAYAVGDPQADLNGDGNVDTKDLAIFAADFGRTDCPPCP